MVRQQVSSSAGGDATPGRSGGLGLSEGQPLAPLRYRLFHLIFGVCLPAASIAAESLTGWSARVYVNPIPNQWMLALELTAPASNLYLWIRCCAWRPRKQAALVQFVTLWALVVSVGYCLLFAPIVPAALILSLFAVGLLPLAPFFSFYSAWHFRTILSTRVPGSLVPFLVGTPALSTARRILCQTTE